MCPNPLIHSTASDQALSVYRRKLSNLISQEKNLSGYKINGRAGIFFFLSVST